MSLSIAVVVREDPFKTHRAAEALRIALGLSIGDNPLTVILLDKAPAVLTEEPGDLVDADLLSKHLPVLKELKIPFLVPRGAMAAFTIDSEFAVQEASPEEIAAVVKGSDRVLAF